jgi:S1-C subfamily serine protease
MAPSRSRRRRPIDRWSAIVGLLIVAAPTAACAPDPPSSVVGVTVSGCSLATERGSGVVVDDRLVLTSAHVLRGATSVTVAWPDGTSSEAEIVGFDPEMDLAFLATRTERATPLPVASAHVDDGDTGRAWVVRDGRAVPIDVRIRRRVQINTEDIYVEGETTRPGWELDADIRPGDSGGAVVVDGAVVGVLWARSRRFPGRAYAMDPARAGDRINRQLAAGTLGPDIDLSRCS